jgi:hypothetical protein
MFSWARFLFHAKAESREGRMVEQIFLTETLSPRPSRLTPVLPLISLIGMICYEFSQKRLSPRSSRLTPD